MSEAKLSKATDRTISLTLTCEEADFLARVLSPNTEWIDADDQAFVEFGNDIERDTVSQKLRRARFEARACAARGSR